MTNATREEKRIGLVLARDKMKSPNRFASILKMETETFLSSFFDLKKETLSISVTVDDFGEYDFVIKGKANRMLPCTNL